MGNKIGLTIPGSTDNTDQLSNTEQEQRNKHTTLSHPQNHIPLQ